MSLTCKTCHGTGHWFTVRGEEPCPTCIPISSMMQSAYAIPGYAELIEHVASKMSGKDLAMFVLSHVQAREHEGKKSGELGIMAQTPRTESANSFVS